MHRYHFQQTYRNLSTKGVTMKKLSIVVPFVLLFVVATMFAGCGSSTTTPAALSVTTSTLPNGTIGVAYSQTLVASGGTAPYTWAVTVGSLPAGLVLDVATGVISGTPTTAGASSFTVTATDSATTPATATAALSITIDAMSITTTSLPGGTVGTAYSQTLVVAGGTAPYTWAVTSGNLPAGLTLDANTGVISGTPTAAATSPFTVSVTDTNTATASQALSITIAAPGVDTTPDPFSFTAQTGVALSTVITSNAITVAGINSPAPISVSGGTYSIDGGAYTAATGTVTNGQTVTLRHTSSASNSTTITTTLTIGGVSASFTSTTLAAPALDGAALYATNCAGCHGPLASTSVILPSSVTAINNAISANRGGMGSLSSLSQAVISAIAGVLL